MSVADSTGATSSKPIDEEKLAVDLGSIKLTESSSSSSKSTDLPFDLHSLFTSIFAYVEDCRYLAAYEIYQQLQQHFNYPVHPSKGEDCLEHDLAFLALPSVSQLIEEKGYDLFKLKQLPERVKDIHDAVRYQNDTSEWILGADMFGVKTYYRLDENDHSIIVKLEGELNDLPIFELCAVMKEVDLFHEWVPFCKESKMIDRIGRAEVVPYVWLATPLMGRDFAFQGYAADCMFEHGKIIIAGKSIEDYSKPIPWKKTGWFQDRMKIKELKNIISVLSPKCAQNIYIIHVDPNTRLPQPIINFVMRNLAGGLLYLFSRQAIKANQDPTCSHAKRIREDTEFYRDWLLPKLRAYCDFRGWEQPVIDSLGPDGIPKPKEENATEK